MKESSMIENGMDYLLNALNNLKKFETGEENKYTIKYIIRDLISGIEVILKYRLECENWTFVINDLNKMTKEKYSKGDFVSVTLEQSIERLKNLCDVQIKKDEIKVLRELKQTRNIIEHFKVILEESTAVSLVYNSITFVLNFINNNKKFFEKKFTKEEKNIYKEIKKRVLELNKYLNQREIEIKDKYPNINFKKCYNCLRECLVVNGIECKCYLCNVAYEDTSYARKKYIEENNPTYRDISKGARKIEEIECPECGDKMLLDYENEIALCFYCNTRKNINDLGHCQCCGLPGVNAICEDCMYEINHIRWDDYNEK